MAEVEEPKTQFDIQEKIGDAEEFLNKNRKSVTIIVAAIVLAIAGYLLYEKVYVGGKEKEAESQMFVAEDNFRKDSLKLAISGDKNYPGFEQIIDDYGVSPSANLAHFYLGMSYLKKGEFDKAIETLKSYSAKDDITGSMALGAIGDAYMEQSNKEDAIKYYRKATKESPNKFTTPIFLFKLATANEVAGNYKDAVEAYDDLIKNYPDTQEGRNAIKYKARAEALASK
jgi:TolA-binding protein